MMTELIDATAIEALIHVKGRLVVETGKGGLVNCWINGSLRLDVGDTIQVGDVEDVMVVTGFVDGKGVLVAPYEG